MIRYWMIIKIFLGKYRILKAQERNIIKIISSLISCEEVNIDSIRYKSIYKLILLILVINYK